MLPFDHTIEQVDAIPIGSLRDREIARGLIEDVSRRDSSPAGSKATAMVMRLGFGAGKFIQVSSVKRWKVRCISPAKSTSASQEP